MILRVIWTSHASRSWPAIQEARSSVGQEQDGLSSCEEVTGCDKDPLSRIGPNRRRHSSEPGQRRLSVQDASLSVDFVVRGSCASPGSSCQSAGSGYVHTPVSITGYCDAHVVLDITSNQLSRFEFWVQYAAAAYCRENYASPAGHQISCWANNCPEVQAANTTILFDFSKSVQSVTIC